MNPIRGKEMRLESMANTDSFDGIGGKSIWLKRARLVTKGITRHLYHGLWK